MLKKHSQDKSSGYGNRNDRTATPDLKSNRDSQFSPPQKKNVLALVFEFYSKQTYVSGKHATFDRQLMESNCLDITKFMHFCRDFGLEPKDEMVELFKKVGNYSKYIDYAQFEQSLGQIADIKGLTMEELNVALELGSWGEAKRKLKPFRMAFNMKESKERYGKDEVKYEFRLFHPEVKDQEELRRILEQRRQEKEIVKSQEREKKEKQKIQQELKFVSGTELIRKYPQKRELITKLNLSPVREHKTFLKSQVQNNYYKKDTSVNQSMQLQKQQIESPQKLTWDILNNLKTNQDLIKNLIDDGEDDAYLVEYQLKPQKVKQRIHNELAEKYGNLNSKKRSMSDHSNSNKPTLIRQMPSREIIFRNQIQTKREMEIKLLSKSPNKLNISTMKRAKEIQNLQGIKDRYLYEQIMDVQKRKYKNLMPS